MRGLLLSAPKKPGTLVARGRAGGPREDGGRGPQEQTLLVVGEPEAEFSARAMFPGAEVVASVKETALAEYMVGRVRPDVVVVDPSVTPRGETVEQWVGRLQVSFPGIEVIILPAGEGPGRERQPLAACAAAETRVIGQETIAVWSPKGGVGKTFVAINLACASAISTRGNTCLLDLDLHSGDVACNLDLLDGPSIIDILSNLSDMRPETMERFTVVHPSSGLQVLAAPKRPELSDLVESQHVRAILSLARRRWGLVYVDTPPDITSEVVGECIDQASKIVMVVTQDVAALRQAKMALDILKRIGVGQKEALAVVVNRVSHQSLFPVSRIEEYLEVEVLGSIPDDRKSAEKAGMDGKPVVLYSRNEASQAFWEILGRLIPGLVTSREFSGEKKKRRFGFW
ncbi:MAG TPA: P-loop NTPase [Firmicutes bacterium]|nr:P-loop NTPase [Candidatus Fermentithermobacillaceae bacterium]